MAISRPTNPLTDLGWVYPTNSAVGVMDRASGRNSTGIINYKIGDRKPYLKKFLLPPEPTRKPQNGALDERSVKLVSRSLFGFYGDFPHCLFTPYARRALYHKPV